MHIVSESTLRDFVARHASAATPVRLWLSIMKPSHFRTPHEVKATFGATDFLPGGIVVFDLGGNNFRISATIKYVNERSNVGRVYIRHVMTHAEYTKRSADRTL